MRFLKRFELFQEEFGAAEPKTAPTTRPAEPGVNPGTNPGRRGKPSPIPKQRPGVRPDPKAEDDIKKKMTVASVDDVIAKFAKLTNQNI